MKSVGLSLICFVAGTCVFCGCRREPAASPKVTALIPPDSYAITRQDVHDVRDASKRETIYSMITIRAPRPATISVDWSGGLHRSADLAYASNETVWEGWMELTASRDVPGEKIAYVQTCIDPYIEARRRPSGGTLQAVISAKTEWTNYFDVSISNGTYKLDQPMVIAHFGSHTATMVVGQPTR